MCKYCDYNSDDCCIFVDPLDNQYYLDIETYTWDEYDDCYIHQKEYINYCPYCGRKLSETDKVINGMTDEDIAIVNEFCELSEVHGDELREILIKGYLRSQ